MIVSESKPVAISAENVKYSFDETEKAEAMKTMDSDPELMDEYLTEEIPQPTKIMSSPQSDTVYFPIHIELPSNVTQTTPVETEADKMKQAKIIGGVILLVFIAFIAYSSFKNN